MVRARHEAWWACAVHGRNAQGFVWLVVFVVSRTGLQRMWRAVPVTVRNRPQPAES
jgi:hypothetical protein